MILCGAFPRIRLANMYTIVCAVSAKNHPQILRSQVEQSRAADFCCDKETGAANTWAVLARRMAQSRRKSVPPDLLRVILLWHSDAACRPAGLRLRKRCRHFAVPSPIGLLTPPAGCTKPLRRFSPQGFLFSEQESYPTLTLRAVPQDFACGRDTGTSLFRRPLGSLRLLPGVPNP